MKKVSFVLLLLAGLFAGPSAWARVTPTAVWTYTFTSSPSNTPAQSPTSTRTITRTFTSTSTVTVTPTFTVTVTPTFTATRTITKTPTASPTSTLTATMTITQTFTITKTKTISPTFSISPTFTFTSTITKTATPTPTNTPSFTVSPTPTITPTYTNTPQSLNPVVQLNSEPQEDLTYSVTYSLVSYTVTTIDVTSLLGHCRYGATIHILSANSNILVDYGHLTFTPTVASMAYAGKLAASLVPLAWPYPIYDGDKIYLLGDGNPAIVTVKMGCRKVQISLGTSFPDSSMFTAFAPDGIRVSNMGHIDALMGTFFPNSHWQVEKIGDMEGLTSFRISSNEPEWYGRLRDYLEKSCLWMLEKIS